MPGKTKIEWADYISNPIKARYVAGPHALKVEDKVVKQGHACVKISEGCVHCWASNFNIRLGTGLGYTQPNMNKVEMYLDEKELSRMLKFNPRLPKGMSTFKNGRERAVVFPCDMTDLFGEWVPDEWIDRIFFAMHMTPHVDWFVLTKRPERMAKYLTDKHNKGKVIFDNIFMGCTVENQKRADERREAMQEINLMHWKTWVSFEPALENVSWTGWKFLDGMVCGGESGVNARPMPLSAALGALNYCILQNISFYFKQWGEWAPINQLPWIGDDTLLKYKPVVLDGALMCRVGKGNTGRQLLGREWNEMAR